MSKGSLSKGGFPTAVERKVCHASRDAFFACLDQHKDDDNKCLQDKGIFDQKCPKTWVKYFCRRRDYKKYSERLDREGYIPTENENRT